MMMTIKQQGGSSAEATGPFRLKPSFSERPWGRPNLLPWYAETGKRGRVGEAWLTGPESVIETGVLAGRTLVAAVSEDPAAILGDGGGEAFPLLVKMLFPAEKLSVQVHPDDSQARAMGQPRGKTECWYALEAEPGATVALGIKAGVTEDEIRSSVESGTMEELLQWVRVDEGDMIFVDAGTVHAIGPGLVLLETQQTCDVTFRMFDYGRPRELHLEQGLGVMKMKTEAGKIAPRTMNGFVRLIEQRYFTVDRFDPQGAITAVRMEGPGCLVGLRGTGVVRYGDGRVDLLPGQAVVVPVHCGEVMVEGTESLRFVRCIAPA